MEKRGKRDRAALKTVKGRIQARAQSSGGKPAGKPTGGYSHRTSRSRDASTGRWVPTLGQRVTRQSRDRVARAADIIIELHRDALKELEKY
jgi:hypothetical protein